MYFTCATTTHHNFLKHSLLNFIPRVFMLNASQKISSSDAFILLRKIHPLLWLYFALKITTIWQITLLVIHKCFPFFNTNNNTSLHTKPLIFLYKVFFFHTRVYWIKISFLLPPWQFSPNNRIRLRPFGIPTPGFSAGEGVRPAESKTVIQQALFSRRSPLHFLFFSRDSLIPVGFFLEKACFTG